MIMNFFLSIILLLPAFAFSQTDSLQFNYSGVDSVGNTTISILFGRAKVFIADAFTSTKDVVPLDDLCPGSWHTIAVNLRV